MWTTSYFGYVKFESLCSEEIGCSDFPGVNFVGVVLEQFKKNENDNEEEDVDLVELPLERYSIEELSRMMQKCADNENYERALEIKKVIELKKQK